MATKGQKRKDKDRIVLKAGESQRPNGTCDYRWTGKDGKRHAVYAKSLEELREKEAQIENDALRCFIRFCKWQSMTDISPTIPRTVF